jgi:hypothetical protein
VAEPSLPEEATDDVEKTDRAGGACLNQNGDLPQYPDGVDLGFRYVSGASGLLIGWSLNLAAATALPL